MKRLASIYEDVPGGEGRGTDLRCEVAIPTSVARDGGRWDAVIPDELPGPDGAIRRVVDGLDEPGRVALHLPANVPDGATLRLRGRGGVDRSPPGDLYVTLRVDPSLRAELPATVSRRGSVALAALGAIAALAAGWLASTC